MTHGVTELPVHNSDIRAQLPKISGSKLVDFQLDDNVAALVNMKKEKVKNKLIDVAFLVCDCEWALASDESHASSKLHQGALQTVHERLLDLTFGEALNVGQMLENIGIFDELLRQFRIR